MLLGRDPERHALDAALADARLNRSAVLVLVGEVGIGKTTLLEYAVEQAGAAGMRVLRARGIESEARVPFAGLLELLRPALGALEQIPEPQRAALEGALALRPATAQDRFAVGAATLSLLAAHAEGAPVAAFVDDAQWLDGSTADALLFAIRRLVADPIAVVIAVREGQASFVDGAQLQTLHLGGLDREAAAALVGDDAVDRLYAATAGNPLALLELAPEATRLTDLPIDAPVPIAGSVAQGFVRRAESLPEATQRALLVAAASDTGELQTLEGACPGAVQDLVAGGVGRSRHAPGRLRRVQPRPGAVGGLRGRAARGASRGASRARRGAAGPRRRPPRVASRARHRRPGRDRVVRARAGRRPRVRPKRLRRRSRRLRARSGSVAGARPPGLPGCRRSLARRPGRARDLVAGRRRAGADDLRLALAIEHLRGQITARRGPVRLARSILADAAERAAASDPELAVVMLAEATMLSFYAGDALAMVVTAGRATELAAGLDGRAPILAGLAYGMALVFAGEGDSGAHSIRKAVARLEASDELRDDPYLAVWAAQGPLWLREAEAGRSLYERALDARPQPGGARRDPRAAHPRGARLGHHRRVARRARRLQRGGGTRPRDRAGRLARVRARGPRLARGAPGTRGRVPRARGRGTARRASARA